MSIFALDDSDFQRLQQAMLAWGEGVEDVLNNYLANEANQMLNPTIVNLIPVSDRNKTHARYSDPIIGEQKNNLELYIHTQKPYHYLYFPQTASGIRFVGKTPNDFMEKGLDAEMDNIVNGLLDVLIKDLNL